MRESTKIDFRHRKITDLWDFTELMGVLFPVNRNQQYAACCIFFELKWADDLLSDMRFIEARYSITRRILQRTRAKLSRLGLIEHISYLNNRHGGKHGWKLSYRFEAALRLLADRCFCFRDKRTSQKDKDRSLLSFVDARRKSTSSMVLWDEE
ncbi:hypothetical protein ACFL6U_25290 [Planctomycetota bacterium]